MTQLKLSPSLVRSVSTCRVTSSRLARARWSSLWVGCACGWLIAVVFGAVFADVLPLRDYARLVSGLPTRSGLQWGAEVLGTDAIGRSQGSRIIYGARPSLTVGLCSVALGTVVGIPLGAVAGYFRGPIDAVIRVLLDTLLSLPAIVVLLAAAAVGKRDLTTMVIALAAVIAPVVARLARTTTVALAGRESIVAARAMGATHLRILLRELCPEVALRISPLMFLIFGQVVVAEGTLSFLGLGLAPPTPSWGGMVNDGRTFLSTDPLLVFVPSMCLLFTVMSFTILGDALRTKFDRRGSGLA